jgi:hypothetical protein
LTNTWLFTPFLKSSKLKFVTPPTSTCCPKNGSQRTPALTVTRSVARQASCA